MGVSEDELQGLRDAPAAAVVGWVRIEREDVELITNATEDCPA